MVSVPFCSQIFVTGWFVLRPLRWCSAVASCHRLSLGWPPHSISLLQLSLLLCPWGLCSSSFPPTRLWSSRLAFRSVTMPLVFSWLVSVFLPSLPSWSVGSPGSLRLGMPLHSGVLFPGYPCSVSSVVSVRFPSLLPLLLLRCLLA